MTEIYLVPIEDAPILDPWKGGKSFIKIGEKLYTVAFPDDANKLEKFLNDREVGKRITKKGKIDKRFKLGVPTNQKETT